MCRHLPVRYGGTGTCYNRRYCRAGLCSCGAPAPAMQQQNALPQRYCRPSYVPNGATLQRMCRYSQGAVLVLYIRTSHGFLMALLGLRSPRGSTAQYIQSHLPSQTRHNQQHKQPQTANTQKRLYKHACIRVAPLQPNEWPLSRHLLQSNSAAALLCSAHQRCFDYSHAPLAAAGLGSLPHKLVWPVSGGDRVGALGSAADPERSAVTVRPAATPVFVSPRGCCLAVYCEVLLYSLVGQGRKGGAAKTNNECPDARPASHRVPAAGMTMLNVGAIMSASRREYRSIAQYPRGEKLCRT
ncbi:hypothetical protein M431DRAFT_483509 [Trichoderma harzianum CBS 226.95]|uniref:Uncharacterized protein n=1 Tax=Trichoderma harzianum CBS 226.95 TaxID=983964 RepID=A0A2T4A8G9_TRIHA|nr:hypothetical protein M431DRAFT_483509 [Trichoderma harzianum CBS 226.95]PTB53357.1 hypothetical protein M431DRAFT_483509 [Trichoderma harzianum CBS 226.95]